ncbi:MAG: DUF1292 domain-containing protein [Clostridia bacterium]|nr:DUF1292 domain-containing protein [Clostridia bacterium]
MSRENEDILEEEENDGLIELVDEDGKVINFTLAGITEYKGEKYAMLLPAEPNDDVAEDEVAIFRYIEKDGVLEAIEDDALLEEVFEFWQNEEESEEAN